MGPRRSSSSHLPAFAWTLPHGMLDRTSGQPHHVHQSVLQFRNVNLTVRAEPHPGEPACSLQALQMKGSNTDTTSLGVWLLCGP